MRRGALGVNKCAKQDALLFVEQNEQRAGQARQEGLEQQGDDVKGADGVAEGCTGGNGHQHLGTVGDGAQMLEKVSSREAERLGLMPYSSATSLAMGPAMTMATVLLAVAISMRPTSRPMPSWPPRLPRNTRRMKARMLSKPP